jgi:hypothetical protein
LRPSLCPSLRLPSVAFKALMGFTATALARFDRLFGVAF